jgi:periplasmic divalent cation tolerance protein
MARSPKTRKRADAVVVLVTTSSEEEARRIGRRLVENKVAACVNIVPSVHSIFEWDGRISSERETLMMIKTQARRVEELSEVVKKHHSYQVPEIIALPVTQGSDKYLKWIATATRAAK